VRGQKKQIFSGNCWKFITNYEFSGSYYEEWICFQHGPETLNYEHFERAQSRKRLASTSSLRIIDLNWNGSLTRLDLLRYSMVPLKHASGHDSESFFQGSFSKQSSSRPVAWHLQGRIYYIDSRTWSPICLFKFCFYYLAWGNFLKSFAK
jgi:hypothetical protein